MASAERRASDISRAVGDVVLGRYKRLRLSQADLVERTGISVTTVRRLIAGEAEFDVGQLWLIADALNVSPADVLWEAEMSLSAASSTQGGRFSNDRKLPHAAIADPELDAIDPVP
jgi:transcriptional regulator with XRE-family HTH domain